MDTRNELHVSQISVTNPKLQVRDPNKNDFNEFLSLKESIVRHGILEPIIVRPVNNRGSYEVVAGNRRLQAVQELEWKTIPAIIQQISDVQLRRIAFVENVHREDIIDDEKAKSIAAIYQDIGYPPAKAIQIVKVIHNRGFQSQRSTLKDPRGKRLDESLTPKQDFVDAFKDIGLSANMQYQLLQLVVQIAPEVLEEATRKGLTFQSKLGLTHPAIRKKSKKEQQEIIDDVKGFKGTKAKQRIRQHIEASQKGRPSPPKVEDKPTRDLLLVSMDVGAAIDKLITTITDRPLSRGEAFFTEEIINSRKDQIFALIKAMGDTKQLDAFEEQMNLLAHLLRCVEETIDEVRASNRKQRELLRP